MGSACASHGATHTTSSPSSPADSFSLTLETSDSRLSAALLGLALRPSAQRHLEVAREYQRLGVLDKAHEHYSRAVVLDPTDAAGFDALARIWRDWGVPSRGLGDAYRAVYFAGRSPIAANTLGTLLQALGDVAIARQWYQHALDLDPNARYASNNLCYASIVMRDPQAVTICKRAASIAADSKMARNNLALAYAAAGELVKARKEFRLLSDGAAADYNDGILYLAMAEYRKAARAFGDALQANPRFTLAAARARQARLRAEVEDQRGAHN